MSVQDVYDFETPVEAAVAAAMKADGIACYTPLDDAQFQRERPRVEVEFLLGAGQRIRPFISATGNDEREAAWTGQIKLQVISKATIAGHREFVARVRNVMADIRSRVNGIGPLVNHKIQFVVDGGCSPAYKPEDGYYVQEIFYNTHLSVQQNAWALLTA